MELLLFIFSVWGITAIISLGEVFNPFRQKLLRSHYLSLNWIGKLIHCPQCLGFWVALGISCFWSLKIPVDDWLRIIFQAGIGSGACLLLSALLLALGWED